MKIINLVKESITPDFISKISSELGENETNLSNAIQAYIPILLGSVLEKKESVPNLYDSIKKFGITENITNLIPLQRTPDVITNLKNKLFGTDIYSITDKVADYSGLSEISSSKILDLTAIKTFSTLGKEIDSNQVTENDFFKHLKNSKDEILKLLPVGLSLSALGLGAFWKPVLKKETVNTSTNYYPSKNKKNNNGFLKTLIPILLLLAAAFLLFKYCKGISEKPVVEDANGKRVTADTIKVPKEISTIHLDDINLKAYQNGLEHQIITFIHAPEFNELTEEQLKTKWFDFDNVNFVFGKTDQLEPGSELQVENLTAILKKYPNVKIKIGAYTDKKGDDKLNKEISQKRADFLKSELTKQGVGTQVISAEGYGEEFAKVDENASDEERASDRKMSLRFTK